MCYVRIFRIFLLGLMPCILSKFLIFLWHSASECFSLPVEHQIIYNHRLLSVSCMEENERGHTEEVSMPTHHLFPHKFVDFCLWWLLECATVEMIRHIFPASLVVQRYVATCNKFYLVTSTIYILGWSHTSERFFGWELGILTSNKDCSLWNRWCVLLIIFMHFLNISNWLMIRWYGRKEGGSSKIDMPIPIQSS